MSSKRVMLSLVIPTYNERENLPKLMKRIHESIGSHCRYEAIVVDDNSPDETWKVAEELSKEYPIRLIRRRSKLGLSSAVIEGFRHSSGDYLGVMDADLQHPPEVLPILVKEIEKGKDVVIASRYVERGEVKEWNSKRRVLSKGATFLARSLVPEIKNIEDPLSGFFIFRREVIRGIDLNPVGYKVLVEILVKGHYDEVSEVPFTFDSRKIGESKLTIGEYANYLKHLARLSWVAEGTTKVVGYAVTGLLSLLVNTLFFLLLTTGLHLNYFFSAVLSVEAMILFNIALNGKTVLWKWQGKEAKNVAPWVLKYNLFCLGGLMINIMMLWILTDLFNLYYFASNFFGAVGATLWNHGGMVWSTLKLR